MPCDGDIITGQWYRFQGDAGTRMATACPDIGSCGARFPGWLDGDPPTVTDGEEIMQVKFHKNNCDDDSKYITVGNCGGYTIYQLVMLANTCQYRYCGTD